MRYIDADALLLHLSDYQLQESPTWGANGYGNKDKYEAITDCIKAVEEQPTADVRPNVKGKWVHKSKQLAVLNTAWWYECSACGHHAFNGMRTDFCPNCGSYNGGDTDE